MSSRPRVPALWSRLAGLSVPPTDRDSLLGDLEERFAGRSDARGQRAARRWYRRQALGLLLGVAPRRLLGFLRFVAAPGTARAAVRSLLRSPGASLACMATLAVGIAAPVGMFALADGTTSSLPGDPGDRVVRVSRADREGRVAMGFPWSVVEAWSEGAVGPGRPLADLAAFRSDGPLAVGGGEVAAVVDRGVYATPGLFRLLGVGPVVGRLYGDGVEGGWPAVLIREDLWEERFGRDPAVLGRVLRIDGTDHVVVGVLPRDFGFPVDHRLWMQPTGVGDDDWSVVGRLAPGAAAGAARERLAAAMPPDGPETDETNGRPPARQRSPEAALRVQRYTDAHFANDGGPETSRRIGLLSLILVLVTAMNVAAVMVARGVARSRETAVRMALGASRSQVMALTLTEGLVLAGGGGVLGLALGRAGLEAMVRYLVSQATIVPYWMDFGLGMRSVALAVLLTLLALAVAAVPSALRAWRTDLDHALRRRRHGGPAGRARLMTWALGLEVALSCVLLAVSGVVAEDALARLRTGADFPTEGVLTGRFVLDPPDYAGADRRRAFLAQLREALRADPSVLSASLTGALPGKEGVVVPAGPAGREAGPEGLAPAQVRSVDPAFFPVLGLSASAGRLFSDDDDPAGEPVAVVNQAFVRRHGLADDAPGRRIVVGGAGPGSGYLATVVGVVDDRGATPRASGQPALGVYLPLEQVPPPAVWLVVRTRGDESLFDVWQRAVAPLDPYLPLGDVLTLDETLRRGHGAATLFLSVFLGLGGMTLLVALVGLHGVHSFVLAGRVREIGVRRALGARRGQVLREGVRRGLRPVWAGALVGTAPGFWVARAALPVETEVWAWILAPALLVLASLIAVWRPTRRASRTDPMEVLRES